MQISVALQGGNIEFHVVNGIPACPPENNRIDKGIGLENLRRRLELLYPERHTLTTEKNGKNFSAALTLQYL